MIEYLQSYVNNYGIIKNYSETCLYEQPKYLLQNSKLLSTLANAIDNREELKKRIESSRITLQELQTCLQNCQNRFGGKSELATEDDIR